MQVTVAELIQALEDYDENAKVIFVEHQYRGPSHLYRADDIDRLRLQRHFTFKPGLDEPADYVVLNLTHLAMTNDYVPVDGEHIRWPGQRE